MSGPDGKDSVVIVGGGQAGFQLGESLREEGFDGPIRLVCDEPVIPYQRPPLSKQLATETFAEDLAFAGPEDLASLGIDFELGRSVTAIDRLERRVELNDGRKLNYGHLVLATGARNRTLGGEASGSSLALRHIADAQRLTEHLRNAPSLLVIGGGFLGLEVAALAASLGKEVDVVEAGAAMGRGVTRKTAEWFVQLQRSLGVRVHENVAVEHISADRRGAVSLKLADGRALSASGVLVSIGVVPNTDLAVAAGLPVANGIVTDECLRTADHSIFAIGDCAAFPEKRAGGLFRLESVQNAVDQARHVAASIVKRADRYDALPWFWSEQGDARLQIAGLAKDIDDVVTRGDTEKGQFSNFCFASGKLVAVESVNVPGDHMNARKCLSSGILPDRTLFDDDAFDFRGWVKASQSKDTASVRI